MNVTTVGEGKVYLLNGNGRSFTDVAARFVSSEKSVNEIIASPYSAKIVNNILSRGHLACTEFDWYVFGIEGYSRVCETQLVRKRLASYMVKSGRLELNGKRKFEVTLPASIQKHSVNIIHDGLPIYIDSNVICSFIERWYEAGIKKGVPEEDLRYLKPQATSTRMLVGMNAHSLLDFFNRRCCNKAQYEIRDLANKMLRLVKANDPDVFAKAGPPCRSYGYCPENDAQCSQMKGKVLTLSEMVTKCHE